MSGGAGQLGEQHTLSLRCGLRQAPGQDWDPTPPPGQSDEVILLMINGIMPEQICKPTKNILEIIKLNYQRIYEPRQCFS